MSTMKRASGPRWCASSSVPWPWSSTPACTRMGWRAIDQGGGHMSAAPPARHGRCRGSDPRVDRVHRACLERRSPCKVGELEIPRPARRNAAAGARNRVRREGVPFGGTEGWPMLLDILDAVIRAWMRSGPMSNRLSVAGGERKPAVWRHTRTCGSTIYLRFWLRLALHWRSRRHRRARARPSRRRPTAPAASRSRSRSTPGEQSGRAQAGVTILRGARGGMVADHELRRGEQSSCRVSAEPAR